MVDKKFIKYQFRKYNLKYKKQFQLEKRKLKKFLPDLKIEHIGSTAIEELGGKGIIDIMVGGKKRNLPSSFKKLEDKGYKFIKIASSSERFFFRKDYNLKGTIRRVHIHLTKESGVDWKKCILFRRPPKKKKEIA